MVPPFDILAADIERCMLRDRFRLRRRLNALRQGARDDGALQKLEEQITGSLKRRQAREAARPQPTYPAELPVVQPKDEIARAIAGAQVLVVCGETGSASRRSCPKSASSSGAARQG